MDVQSTADDVLASLLALDGVNEVYLLKDAFDGLDDRLKDKFVELIKDEYELIPIEDAREMVNRDGPD